MKNAILAGSIAWALLMGTNAHANDGISSDRLIAQVTAENQYREKVTKNVMSIVGAVTPEGMVVKKFDNRVLVTNWINREKVWNVSVGIYLPLEQQSSKWVESGTYFGVGYTRQTGSGNSVPGVVDNTRKWFEVQLRKEWRF
jgi:hypothetical protein